MTKELEAFEDLKRQVGNMPYTSYDNGLGNRTTFLIKDSAIFPIIENALKEYESAKNIIKALNKERAKNIIKIKALEIIRETRVDTNLIKLSEDYDHYCSMEAIKILNNVQTTKQKGITEEEYNLLKEVLL